ncbi:MAG: hypothetical protein KFF73_09535 [Cyclobacteriaceae bacterium]|nr:hypothetical protein [Cyclobacteriaceae bacterium]
MNSIKKLAIIIVFIACGTVHKAQDSGFGLGLYLGEPTGIGMKGWVSQNGAIAGAMAWTFAGDGQLHIHADYHRHSFTLINVDKGQLPVYYGIGAKIVFQDNPILGARIPLGINYIFDDAPLDIFAEIVPGLKLIPETDFDLAGGLGIRYFFGQ